MDNDQILVIGIILGILSIPALLAAFSESRAPRSGSIMILIAGTLIVVALTQEPSGYTFAELPQVVTRVVGGWIN